MTRSVLRLFAVFAMVAALFVAITPASADVPDVTYVRTIGGPGHAELYAWGMATDIDGNILVGDYNNYVVARYSTTGNLMQTFSGMGDGPGETRQPYGLTVDPNDGSIYVADLNTHEIEKFNANGTFNKTLSYWDWRYAPRVAANSEGNLYVVDSHNVSPDFRDVIHVHDSDGNWLFDFGASGSGPGQLGIIRGIAIGPNDEVYLGDAQQRLIHVFDKNGNFQFAFGGSWLGYDPRGSRLTMTTDGSTSRTHPKAKSRNMTSPAITWRPLESWDLDPANSVVPVRSRSAWIIGSTSPTTRIGG